MKPPKYDIKEFPAFPVSTPSFSLTGMTMRDYFAAKAMPWVYADYCESANTIGFEKGWRDGVAIDAYAMADAMLKAREA